MKKINKDSKKSTITRNRGLRIEWLGWYQNLQLLGTCRTKLAFAIRTRDVNGLTPKVCWVLQWFRLCQIFNSIFVKPNKASVNIPRTVKSLQCMGILPPEASK